MRIVHLSDIHFSPSNKDSLEKFYGTYLLNDLVKYNKIDFIVITGDLIDKGGRLFGKEINKYNSFNKSFLMPIVEKLKIRRDSIIIGSGNHDLEINENNYEWNYIKKRCDNFISFEKKYYRVIKNSHISILSSWFLRKWKRRNIGFISINTNWLCLPKSNKSNDIFIGLNNLRDIIKKIKEFKCDLKIALIHHPIELVSDIERSEFKNILLNNFNIIFIGHNHENETNYYPSVKNGILLLNSKSVLSDPRTDSKKSVPGYTILDIEEKSVTIHYRIYDDTNMCFTSNESINKKEIKNIKLQLFEKNRSKKSRKVSPNKNCSNIHILFENKYIKLLDGGRRFLNLIEKNDIDKNIFAEYIKINFDKFNKNSDGQSKSIYFAKYVVTNKLYNNFVNYLNPVYKKDLYLDQILNKKIFNSRLKYYKNALDNNEMKKYLPDSMDFWPQTVVSKIKLFEKTSKYIKKNKPVVGITKYDAILYCFWLNTLINDKNINFRLPTASEWSWAATNGHKDDYPWSFNFNSITNNVCHYGHPEADKDGTLNCPIEVYFKEEGCSKDGLMNMSGNVWEWAADNHQNFQKPILKGGAWYSDEEDVKCQSFWLAAFSGWWDYSVGFRVICEIIK
jgi:formylglycine-generating enzyme required for sulfatase activity/predicted phosphodiesterase